MRYLTTLSSILLAAIPLIAATPPYIEPAQDSVRAYAREVRPLYAQPVFTLAKSDLARTISEGRLSYLVQNSQGKTGWVEKSLVRPGRLSARMTFSGSAVDGWIDNPGFWTIQDDTVRYDSDLVLERSFADALRENIDRESTERASSLKF